MNAKQWNWIILLGVLMFMLSTALLLIGQLEVPWSYFLLTAGLSLIAIGSSSKRRASQEKFP